MDLMVRRSKIYVFHLSKPWTNYCDPFQVRKDSPKPVPEGLEFVEIRDFLAKPWHTTNARQSAGIVVLRDIHSASLILRGSSGWALRLERKMQIHK
jgi:hypothetical protein